MKKLLVFGSLVVLMSLVEIYRPEEECKHEYWSTCAVYGCNCATCINCGKQIDDITKLWQPTPEPNEPSIIEIECPCGLHVKVEGYELCYSQKVSMFTAIEPPPEPNNPLDFIPTWPEYIELDKNLWIIDEQEYGLTICLAKGTKIYFKEEE